MCLINLSKVLDSPPLPQYVDYPLFVWEISKKPHECRFWSTRNDMIVIPSSEQTEELWENQCLKCGV